MAKVGKPKAAHPPKLEPKALDPRNHDWELTEEDREQIREGVAYGLAHAAEYAASENVDLPALIGLYSDAEAEALFWTLRERFWARVWTPEMDTKGAAR